MLKEPRDAGGRTRFKMWYRLVGSAVEHAAKVYTKDWDEKAQGIKPDEVDFQKLFLVQEAEGDEDSASLAGVLDVLVRRWVAKAKFKANDVAEFINKAANADADAGDDMRRDGATLREFLFGKTPAGFVATPQAVSGRLKAHRDEPVQYGDRTLILRGNPNRKGVMEYHVEYSEPERGILSS